MRTLPQRYTVLDALDDVFRNSFVNKENKGDILNVDIKETADHFILQADVPGVAKEDIKVNFDKGALNIQIEQRKSEDLKEGETLVRSERFFSKKYRSFDLGDSVDEANIEAEYKDGVLILTFPKKESAKVVKQIEIK